ncbi:MAG: N-6 DNA methylase [Pirellulaceae bacterium]|nr:N-6 DNA methylase [Pirellulaceae bacterium]
MVKTKDVKPKKKAGKPTAEKKGSGTLELLEAKLAKSQFDQRLAMEPAEEGQACSMVWGDHKGEETPRIFVLALPVGSWEKANAEYVQQLSYTQAPTGLAADEYAKFALVGDGKNEAMFDLEYPAHEVDRLPSIEEIKEYKRIKADPTRRWSLKMYDRLMNGFNAFHEQVYQTVKDKVDGKNAIILEVAKLLFLESFRLHHDGKMLEFTHEGKKLNLSDVFTFEYVQKHGKQAVAEIQSAFDLLKTNADYVVTDDKGDSHPIFDRNEHLRLEQPRNYETILELIQNLGPVLDNSDKVLKEKASLKDVANDVLGRAFDVFLRANFDSKGGLAIYLTPAPVKQAMLEIAFHDILEETPEILSARDADGKPSFRYCDPACGTYGFGVVAHGHLRRALNEIGGRETSNDRAREKLFNDMCEQSFVGADSAPIMVTLARVNMAMLGAPKARIFYSTNSLISEQLQPCSFDLICTNPPFGTPKFKKGQENAKRDYEERMKEILAFYRSDLEAKEGKSKTSGYEYKPRVDGLAMGGKPNSKGVWQESKATSVDPAVLFLDRCLQLLKPGGRLLIILPDGVLCNSGDRYVREYIMGKKDETTGQFHGGKAIVKAVISLPSDTFKLSGTGAKTSVLYLQKRHERDDGSKQFMDEPQTDVFMAVADTLGYEVKNNVEDYSKGLSNDLAKITGAYVRGE